MLVLLVRRGEGFGASLFMSKYFGGWAGGKGRCVFVDSD